MSNNKQSSVEWLLDRIEDVDSAKIWGDIKKQAKAMHKEEIEEAFANGVDDEYEYHINNEPRKNTEQYYNETYGGGEQ